MEQIALDFLRVGHMISFGIGIGAALFLEVAILDRFRDQISASDLVLLQRGHDLISVAVKVLWMTGLGLLVMKAGVLGEPMTAKLVAKFAIVSVLTANMVAIGRYVLPALIKHEGQAISQMPALQRARFGAIGGISAACWMTALAFGGIAAFRTMDLSPLLFGSALVVCGSALVGAIVGLRLGLVDEAALRRERRFDLDPA